MKYLLSNKHFHIIVLNLFTQLIQNVSRNIVPIIGQNLEQSLNE
jgi:hypothetical protein